MMHSNANRGVVLWLLSGCFIIYLMVVVGCITRLTHSGLSITHWSITGGLPPLSNEEWTNEFLKYKQSPEFIKLNFDMSQEEFKSIYWWEWTHRFIGRGILTGVFLLGFAWFLLKKKLKGKLLLKTSFLFLLGAAQGLIGWWMVKSGLVDNPAVSHYRLAIHLMSAFTCFAFTFWFALELMNPLQEEITAQEAVPVPGQRKLRPWIIALFVVLIAQIVFGAFTAGLKAGLLYPTWPKMGGQWFPSESILVSDSFITNFFERGEGVQFVHRTFALVVVTLVAVVWIRSNHLKLSRGVHRGVSLIIYGTTVQFILGIYTLIHQVPVVLGVLHQTGAFFLFASCIYLLFQASRRPAAETAAASSFAALQEETEKNENPAAV